MTGEIDPATKASIEKWETLRRPENTGGSAKRIRELEAEVARLTSALAAAREECAKIADKWTERGHILLHAGELRSVKAVATAVAAAIRALHPTEPTKAERAAFGALAKAVREAEED